MNMYAGELDPKAPSVAALPHAQPLEFADDEPHAIHWLDRFSVSKKLHAAVLASTLVLTVMATIILGGMTYYSSSGETLRVNNLAEVYKNHIAVRLASSSDALDLYEADANITALSEAKADIYSIQTQLDEALALEDSRLIPGTSETFTEYRDQVAALKARLDDPRLNRSSARTINRDIRALFDSVDRDALEFSDKKNELTGEVFGEIKASLIGLLVLLFIGTTIAVLGARMIVRNIAGMIKLMTDAMERIAAGETNTSIPCRDREDEIGAMARALVVFRRSTLDLEGLDAARADAAEQALAMAQEREQLRAEKVQLLGKLADGFESSIVEVTGYVADASSELQKAASTMVSVAEKTNGETSGAAKAMDATSQHVVSAAAASDEFALSILEISKQASSSAEMANNVLKSVDGANERIKGLDKATEEIGEIADLIQSIASRTNLLALNASIEAARGGEAGRGFAVVASEVKELAFKTSEATANVASKIAAIQSATGASVKDLAGIAEEIHRLEQASTAIASAVDQQSISGQELARNIDEVAATSRDVAQTLVNTSEASRLAGQSATAMLNSSSEMQAQANDLREQARKFLAQVREANQAV